MVKTFAEYREKLRGGYVMLDAEERRKMIEADAGQLASKNR